MTHIFTLSGKFQLIPDRLKFLTVKIYLLVLKVYFIFIPKMPLQLKIGLEMSQL
jgi:hypothetical protein